MTRLSYRVYRAACNVPRHSEVRPEVGTRSLTHFIEGDADSPVATIYRHWDGNPEWTGTDIYKFFSEVEAQASDWRFSDPSYLAAKYVVFLAGIFGESEKPLQFLGVGILPSDSDAGQEFVYYVDCSNLDDEGRPVVTCFATDYDGKPEGESLDIPRPWPAKS